MIPVENLNFKQLLQNTKAIILDVDGVLSTAVVLIGDDGELHRTTNIKDGFAIQLALRMALKVAIISGGKSEAVVLRYKKIGVENVYINVKDKKTVFAEILTKLNLKASEVLYMGDDLPDYEVMKMAGIATCPLDAAQEIKSISLYVSGFRGGEGCVRDIIEQVLRCQGKWMTKEAFVLC